MPIPPHATCPNQRLQAGFAVAVLGTCLLFAGLGQARPPADWKLLDLAGEGSVALLTAGWLWLVLASRPAGRVTLWLALGLAGVSLGAWCDCLDEVFVMEGAWRVDKWLESGLMPLGLLALTWGLLGWRREQVQLSEHMVQRERLFREHRAFDRITELADADYLRGQLAMDRRGGAGSPAALLMLEVGDLQALVRAHGRRDGVRALRAVTHQLLLNLRNEDLLCRYAGDRFLVLLPGLSLPQGQRVAAHLRRMVEATAFHTGADGTRVALTLRWAAVEADASGDAEHLLEALNRALEAERGAASALPSAC